MTSERRIEALETQVAFYERDAERLRDAIDAQQRQILALERRCELLAARIAALAEGDGGPPPGDERPPHY